MIRTETLIAGRALKKIRAASRPDGVIILNGEDFSVGDYVSQTDSAAILVGLSRDTPLVRNHLRAGGSAVWTSQQHIWSGTNEDASAIGPVADLTFALGGAIGFQVHNALMAAAIARSCGISRDSIASGLASFEAAASTMPGSFNVLPIVDALAVVDRPAPSWFLRTTLRGIHHLLPGRRLLTVAGPMDAVPEEDLVETGRLLGRAGGALILYGTRERPERMALLRQGVAANEVPPVIIHVGTERQAVARMLKMLRPDDLAFILADQPATALRALSRAQVRSAGAMVS